MSLISVPTAAVYSYGLHKLGRDQRVLIFDLGGSSLDIAVLEIVGHNIELKAVCGDPELGGTDWDDALLNYCAKLFKAEHGSDPRDDNFSYQELYDRVLKAKISLSQRPKTRIQVSHEGARENIDMPRETFEEISQNLLALCQSMCGEVLAKGNKTWNDIDTILLVGDATYMPMVKDMIKKISGKKPLTDINPDCCLGTKNK